jgi:hypothetical protein
MAQAAWSSLVTGGGLAAGNWIILGLVLRRENRAMPAHQVAAA